MTELHGAMDHGGEPIGGLVLREEGDGDPARLRRVAPCLEAAAGRSGHIVDDDVVIANRSGARGIRRLAGDDAVEDAAEPEELDVEAARRVQLLAPLSGRPLGMDRRGLDLDFGRALRLGDLPLWTLGIRSGPWLVLGTGNRVGACLGELASIQRL